MDQDDKPSFGCKFFDEPDPNQEPAQQQQPWTFNPIQPQPLDLTLHPDQLPPRVGPSQGSPSNPVLQPLPLPLGPAAALPGPPSLFPDDGTLKIPSVPTPLGPLQPMPIVDFGRFNNNPAGPEQPTNHAPIPDPTD